jgi:hypothetical protein
VTQRAGFRSALVTYSMLARTHARRARHYAVLPHLRTARLQHTRVHLALACMSPLHSANKAASQAALCMLNQGV